MASGSCLAAWKLIISPEFGEKVDLGELTRQLMNRIGTDLGTRVEWVAVIHRSTEHPHVHVALHGTDDRAPLHLGRDYRTLKGQGKPFAFVVLASSDWNGEAARTRPSHLRTAGHPGGCRRVRQKFEPPAMMRLLALVDTKAVDTLFTS
jgi:hypothetical protein